MRAQGREEPLQRAGRRGVQLVTAPAAAPAGSRQGKEGAVVSDSAAGMAVLRLPRLRGGTCVWLRWGALDGGGVPRGPPLPPPVSAALEHGFA